MGRRHIVAAPVQLVVHVRAFDHGQRNLGHFWDQRVHGVQGGGGIENDLCFYSRQFLFITVQVTEFQLP